MPTDRPAPSGPEHARGEAAPGGEGAPFGAAERRDEAAPRGDGLPRGDGERGELETAFGLAIRRTGALMQLIGQAAAERIGINATDLNCLNILSLAGTLTAGQLAHATGLTTASITGVVDRLEQAGYVRRERDTGDRRRVVIHVVPESTLRDVAPIFFPMVRDWLRTSAAYSDDELKLILEFQGRTEQVLREHLTRLRGNG
jgi:DNA-binding Lrp family transcriptional regulator